MPPQRGATETGDAAGLLRTIRDYLAEHPDVQLLEGGDVLFALPEASYTLEEHHGRVVLHLWSEGANVIRRILSATRSRRRRTSRRPCRRGTCTR